MREFYAKIYNNKRFVEHKVLADNQTDALLKIMKYYGGSKGKINSSLKFVVRPI